MCIFFILIFSVFGATLLLILLIAMRTSSYESVKDRSMELNKQTIDKTYELADAYGVTVRDLKLDQKNLHEVQQSTTQETPPLLFFIEQFWMLQDTMFKNIFLEDRGSNNESKDKDGDGDSNDDDYDFGAGRSECGEYEEFDGT